MYTYVFVCMAGRITCGYIWFVYRWMITYMEGCIFVE